jgi:hypothetical protein
VTALILSAHFLGRGHCCGRRGSRRHCASSNFSRPTSTTRVSVGPTPQLPGDREKAAAMANHASTGTTQLYDRGRDEVSLDEIERIVI